MDQVIAEFHNKNGYLTILIVKNGGLWDVEFDGVKVQRDLTDFEIVRYLANALEGK